MQNISLTAGMRQNLYELQSTNKLLGTTQSRLATGKKIQSALDDPINYFAAREHLERASDLESRKDAMGEAVQTIKAASQGIEQITDLINAAKSLAQSAFSAATDEEKEALRVQYQETIDQAADIAKDSGYKGINLLDGGEIAVKFDPSGDKKLDVVGFDADDATTGLKITATAEDDWAVASGTVADIAELDAAISTLRTQESKLSNNLSIITARQDFTDGMINILETGANNLTNADMDEEGANMLMLQTRQALGISSLSIASQAAQSVLRLF